MAFSIDDQLVARFVDTPANGVAAVSGTFNSVSNSLILLCVSATSDSATPDITIGVSGGGLTWTKVVEQEGVASSYGGHVSWWWAYVTTGASMTISVTRTAGNGGVNGISCKPYIITGDFDAVAPIGMASGGNFTSNTASPVFGNTTRANSRVFYGAIDMTASGVIVSSDTEESADYPGAASVMSAYKASDTAGSGTSVSGDFDCGGTGSVQVTWAAIELRAPSTGATSDVPVGSARLMMHLLNF